MATITPLLGEQLLIQIGNGASPEVFSAPALINTTRGITFSTSTESEELIDLADQSAAAITARYAKATDWKIDGAGMVSKGDLKEYLTWAATPKAKSVKVTDAATGATWTLTGSAHLTQLQISGERRKAATVQISLESAGAWTVA